MTEDQGMELRDVIAAIGRMDRDALTAVFDAARLRSKTAHAEAALVARATLVPGTRVVTDGLKPKYLNGMRGTVSPLRARRPGDLTITVDEDSRFGREMYVHDGVVAVPAGCLRRLENE